jgi:hypothetical protein
MADMKMKKPTIFTLVLVVIAAFIHIYANDSTRVENQYSTGIYQVFSRILRYVFGWLPFSFGDVFYGLAILWLIWKLLRGIKLIFKKQVSWSGFAAGLGKGLRILLVTYILFNLFWGINYNRVGIAGQLQLKMGKYTPEDLKMINGLLLDKVNAAKQVLINQQAAYPSKKQLFAKVEDAYTEAEKTYPFLKYQPVSLKPSLWSWLGNYMGR